MTDTAAVSRPGERSARVESLLTGAALLILCALFPLWDLAKPGYVLLSLAAMVYLAARWPGPDRERLLFSLPVYGLMLAIGISLAYHGFPERGVNQLTSRYFMVLLAVPIGALWLQSCHPARNIWLPMVFGAWILGLLALNDILVLGKSRADAGGNAVVFGYCALGLFGVLLGSWHDLAAQKHGKVLFYTALAAALLAMVLSGTRGAWLGGLIVFVFALFLILNRFSLISRLLLSIILAAAIGLASLALPQVQKRIDDLVTLASPYLSNQQVQQLNSVSFRVELAKAAWIMGWNNPVFGIGPGNFRDELKVYVGVQPPRLRQLDTMKHAHNEYLQLFATTGLPGMLALVGMLACHGYVFARHMRRNYPPEVRAPALAGCLLVTAFAVGSLTDVLFYDKKTALLYGLCGAILWAGMVGRQRRFERAAAGPTAADTPNPPGPRARQGS